MMSSPEEMRHLNIKVSYKKNYLRGGGGAVAEWSKAACENLGSPPLPGQSLILFNLKPILCFASGSTARNHILTFNIMSRDAPS